MSVELPYRPDPQDRDDRDYPTSETVSGWKALFERTDAEAEREKNELIIRHMAYAREKIERHCGGSRLSTIDLVDLRRMTKDALRMCIAHASLPDDGSKYDASIPPVPEIVCRYLEEIMEVPYRTIYTFRKRKEEFQDFLFRRHEEMHTL